MLNQVVLVGSLVDDPELYQTETGKKYLADPADIEVVEKGFSTALDFESAIVVETQEDLAKKLGKTQSTVANKLRLLNLDESEL